MRVPPGRAEDKEFATCAEAPLPFPRNFGIVECTFALASSSFVGDPKNVSGAPPIPLRRS